ncbi:unnamed protein product [Mycena citricolor]|uniref:DNA 3'-5' helicase n=1 Tax=Mycena citricolor TaxID=2018698 RepID=A0AAD2GWX4_9AGAR|nr:unnamed protein product [Mycena citricolor]
MLRVITLEDARVEESEPDTAVREDVAMEDPEADGINTGTNILAASQREANTSPECPSPAPSSISMTSPSPRTHSPTAVTHFPLPQSRTPSPPVCSPSLGPSTAETRGYAATAGPDTIFRSPGLDLTRFGLIVNTTHQLLICLSCQRAITVKGARRHVRFHIPHMELPDDLDEVIPREWLITEPKDFQHPERSITPIFGLYVEEFYFCGYCHHGYKKETTRDSHQRGCLSRLKGDVVQASYVGHGQSLGNTRNRSLSFPVDHTALVPRGKQPGVAYFQPAVRPDYSRIKVEQSHDANDLDLFVRNSGFNSFVKDYTPAELNESVAIDTSSVDSDRVFGNYRKASQILCRHINGALEKSLGYVKKQLAKVGDDPTSAMHRELTDSSIPSYSRLFAKMLYTLTLAANDKPLPVKFPLNNEQVQLLQGMYNSFCNKMPEEETTLDIILKVGLNLYQQMKPDGSAEHWVLPMNRYLVASLMGPETWLPAHQMTNLCARLEWIGRGIMLLFMRREMKAQRLNSEQGLELVRIYISEKSDSSYAFIYDVHRLLKSISDEFNDAEVMFEDSAGSSLVYKSHRIKVSQFADLTDSLRDQYHSILKEKIFFNQEIPETCRPVFDITEFVDNPRDFAPDYCFLDNPKNAEQVEGWDRAYCDWMASQPHIIDQFTYIEGGTVRWKPGPCYELLECFSQLRMILAIRVLISSGPSVRGTEFARQTLRNIRGGTVRSVLLLYKTLSIVCVLEKNSAQYLQKHFIPHAPTKDVVRDFVINVGIFRPWEHMVVAHLRSPADADRYRMSLWPGVSRDFSGDEISNALGEATENIFGIPLKILAYRKIVSGIVRFFRKPGDCPTTESTYYDLLQNHTTPTSYRHYGVDQNTLANADPRRIIYFISACIIWGMKTGIDRGNPIRIDAPEELPDSLIPELAVQEKPVQVQPLSLAALRSVMEEVVAAAIPRKEELIEPFYQALAEFYASQNSESNILTRHTGLAPATAVVVHPSLINDLRKFRNDPEAMWTHPKQAELVQAMRIKDRHVLGVLACNTGKTTAVLMQAKVMDYMLVTLVVLPVSGLHLDLHTRARQEGLRAAQWLPQNGHASPPFFLSHSPLTFHSFLEQLHGDRRLANLVFDEGHMFLTDSDFRESVTRVCQITRRAEIPITILSGSIGPMTVEPLLKLFCIKDVHEIRTPSMRGNLEYIASVHPRAINAAGHLSDTHEGAAVEYIKFRQAIETAPYRMIVFCCSRADTERVAKELGVSAFHSQIPVPEREKIFRSWVNGETCVMVSTSILGAGIDVDVREVVQIGIAFCLLDSHQQANRAGRDGRPARVLTFASSETKLSQAMESNMNISLGSQFLIPWLFLHVCRRLIISVFLDGAGITCAAIPGAILCDICETEATQPMPAQCTKTPTAETMDDMYALFPIQIDQAQRKAAVARQASGCRNPSQTRDGFLDWDENIRDWTPPVNTRMAASPSSDNYGEL